jgi:CHASE2 domain-containing sensor protein
MQRWLSILGNFSAIKSCYVVIVVVGLLASQLPVVRTIDNWLLDAQFRVLRTIQPRPIADDIVIVGIDEESYEKSDRPVGVWHQPIGKFITALIESEAKVIAFDVVLPVKKYATLIEGHNKVLELAVAMPAPVKPRAGAPRFP